MKKDYPNRSCGGQQTEQAAVKAMGCSSELMRAWFMGNHPLAMASADPRNIVFNATALVMVGNYYLPQITQFSSLSSEISLLPVRTLMSYFTYLVNCVRLIFFSIMRIWYICIYRYSLIIYHETF